MNERESKLQAIRNYLTSYFDLMRDEGLLSELAIRPHDVEYIAEKVLLAVEQVEVEREYAH